MNNERGSILTITVGFVVVFTLLGMASIYLATVQNEAAERFKNSTAAFWQAEMGIELAKEELPNTMNMYDSDQPNYVKPPVNEEGKELYLVKSSPFRDEAQNYIYSFKWDVTSTATVGDQTRTIYSIMDNFSVPEKPVTTNQPVAGDIFDPQKTNGIDPSDVEIDTGLEITKVFDNYRELREKAQTDVFADPDKAERLNFLILDQNDEIRINTQQDIFQVYIIDSRPAAANGLDPVIKFEGDGFLRGILFVIGDENKPTTIVSPKVEGTFFIQGKAIINGEGKVVTNPVIVDQALKLLGALTNDKTTMSEWKEI